MRELIDVYFKFRVFYLSSLPCSDISHQGTALLRKLELIIQPLPSFLSLCKRRNTAQTINTYIYNTAEEMFNIINETYSYLTIFISLCQQIINKNI